MRYLITIGAAIASMISGFKSAKDLFRECRERRKFKDAATVQQKLEKTPHAIRRLYDHGRLRFGKAFTIGDDPARVSITQSLICMNEQLLDVLKLVLRPHGSVLNLRSTCSSLCGASDTVHHEVRDILDQFIQRLLVAAPVQLGVSMHMRPQRTVVHGNHHSRKADDLLLPSTYAPEPKDCMIHGTVSYHKTAKASSRLHRSFARVFKAPNEGHMSIPTANMALSIPRTDLRTVDALEARLTKGHSLNVAPPSQSEDLVSESDHILSLNINELRQVSIHSQITKDARSKELGLGNDAEWARSTCDQQRDKCFNNGRHGTQQIPCPIVVSPDFENPFEFAATPERHDRSVREADTKRRRTYSELSSCDDDSAAEGISDGTMVQSGYSSQPTATIGSNLPTSRVCINYDHFSSISTNIDSDSSAHITARSHLATIEPTFCPEAIKLQQEAHLTIENASFTTSRWYYSV
ncbi:MAG: hypothetical protein M1828_003780 [Chrysothrix sp. TS-e1954]|nr:MAG: hypothetical protein M1828_003780 [Chrysothrix sp. TS-e1954]